MSYERYQACTISKTSSSRSIAAASEGARQAQNTRVNVHDDYLYVEQEYVHTKRGHQLLDAAQYSILVPPNRISKAAVEVVVSHC
jgi:hypothetical protein